MRPELGWCCRVASGVFMIPIATRKRILDLIAAGHSMTMTAGSVGVSVRSVKRIAKESSHAKDDASERRLRRIGRPECNPGVRAADPRLPDRGSESQGEGDHSASARVGLQRGG